MNVTTLAPPASEPVSLAEARAHLRLGRDAEDALVSQLLASARARIEDACGLALIARTLRLTLDAWPCGTVESRRLALPVRPASQLVAVRLLDGQGVAETVTDRFALEPGSAARLVWTGGAFPWPRRARAGIEIDFVAGFGEAPEDVAAGLRLAVKRLLSHAYLTREAETLSVALPEDVAGLLSPWRRVRL